MKAGTDNHIKFRKLKRILNIPMYVACGILESLWLFAAQHADDGYIGRHPSEDICDWIEYDGDPDAFIDALVQSRWLDRREDGTVEIHDWIDHAPTYIRDRWRKRGERRTVQDSPGPASDSPTDATRTVRDSPMDSPGQSNGNSGTVQKCPGAADQFNSIQGNSSQFKPSAHTDRARYPTAQYATPPGYSGESVCVKECSDIRQEVQPKAAEIKCSPDLVALINRVFADGHSAEEIKTVWRWALTSDHKRAAYLRGNGMLSLQQILNGKFAEYLDFARSPPMEFAEVVHTSTMAEDTEREMREEIERRRKQK